MAGRRSMLLALALGLAVEGLAAAETAARWRSYGPADGPLAGMWSDPKTGSTVALWDSPWRSSQQYLRSSDGGRTWTEVHDFSIEVQPGRQAFAAEPGLERVSSLEVGEPSYLGGPGVARMLASTDGGRSWAPAWFPTPPPVSLRDLQSFNPADPREQVYQAIGTNAIVVTKNGGQTWRVIPLWSSGGHANTTVDWIHRVVFTGTGEALFEYQPLDAEASWQSMPLGWTAGVRGGTILQSRNEGIYRSTDGGQSYVLAFPRSFSTYALTQFSFAHAPSSVVYALGVAHDFGGAAVYRSADDGQTWSVAGTFECECDVLSLHVDVLDGDRLMLATSHGVFESSDHGTTFSAAKHDSGLPGWHSEGLIFDATSPGRRWTRSDRPTRTDDFGATWVHDKAGFGIIGEPIRVFNGDVVAGVLFGVGHSGGTRQSFYRSTDGGSHWTHLFEQENYNRFEIPRIVAGIAGELLMLGTRSTYFGHTFVYLHRSTNGGMSWTTGTGALGRANDLTVDHAAGQIYLAATMGLRVSSDGGVTWPSVPGAPIGAVTAIAFDPRAPVTLLAGYGEDGQVPLMRSDDRGMTWVPSAAGMGGGAVRSIVFDATDPAVVYAAQTGQGVFRSADSGRTWRAMDDGLRSRQVVRLQVDPAGGRTLYASTDRGVQSLDLDAGVPSGSARAVEYEHAGWGHFFVTAHALEVAALDAGTFDGWQRTGKAITVFDAPADSALPVCRYFATAFAPQSTHFYSPYPRECEVLAASPLWTSEGEVFLWTLPLPHGGCPPGTRPLFRLFNQGIGGAPNHRYTDSMAILDQMQLVAGWTFEGDGRTRVFACVPR